MKTKVYASSNKVFENLSDNQLIKDASQVWSESRKISGLTLYIGENWNKDAKLKELLLRKGYKQTDFVTFAKDKNGKNTTKIERVNYDFVMAHMKHSAKVLHSVIKLTNEDGTPKLDADGKQLTEKVIATEKVTTVIVEDGKETEVTTIQEVKKVFYTISLVLRELKDCIVTSAETRTILK